jgi:hypothetical protein
MRNATCKSWQLTVAALFFALLAVGPLAAQPTVSFNLTGVNTSDVVWGSSEGIYTSPYYGNVNGGATIPVICDDFADNSYVPESWTAYVTQLSSLSSSGPTDSVLKWSGATVGSTNLSQTQAYDVAAVLAVDILNLNNAAQTPQIQLQQEEYSFAMWALFDPNGTMLDPGALAWLNSNGYPSTTSSFYQQVVTDLNAAVTEVKTSPNSATVTADVNAVTIYSYDPAKGVSNCGGCSGPPQEFIAVNMAEPSSPALLGFDLLSVAGLVFLVRRRFAGSAN